MKSAELMKCTIGGSEQVPHQVLEAAGEQEAHTGRALEDGSHPLRQAIGISVGLVRPANLLELVEEHNDLLVVRLGDPSRKRKGIVEVAFGIPRCEPRREGDLNLLPKLCLRLHHRRCVDRVGDQAASAPGLMNHPPQCGTVRERQRNECLGELRRTGNPEQIDRHRVDATPFQAANGRIADTRLARAPRPRDHEIRAGGKRCGNLPHVDLAANHLAGRDRLIGGKEIAAPLARTRPSYYTPYPAHNAPHMTQGPLTDRDPARPQLVGQMIRPSIGSISTTAFSASFRAVSVRPAPSQVLMASAGSTDSEASNERANRSTRRPRSLRRPLVVRPNLESPKSATLRRRNSAASGHGRSGALAKNVQSRNPSPHCGRRHSAAPLPGTA